MILEQEEERTKIYELENWMSKAREMRVKQVDRRDEGRRSGKQVEPESYSPWALRRSLCFILLLWEGFVFVLLFLKFF